jgi:hypothetical protein
MHCAVASRKVSPLRTVSLPVFWAALTGWTAASYAAFTEAKASPNAKRRGKREVDYDAVLTRAEIAAALATGCLP